MFVGHAVPRMEGYVYVRESKGMDGLGVRMLSFNLDRYTAV